MYFWNWFQKGHGRREGKSATIFTTVVELKKRFPNPAFRGGITVCDDKNGLRPRTVTWLVPLYSPDLGAPSEYLSCHVLTLGKIFRVV